jgi:hypothetical protein
MHSPEKIKELRGKMIKTALDQARADLWPALDPRFDVRR